MKDRQIRIRVAFMMVVMLLVAGSLALVSGQWIKSGYELASEIQQRESSIIFTAASAELENTFGTAPAILNKYANHLRHGTMDVAAIERLGSFFAGEIANAPYLSWISLGTREDGTFIGATRRHDDVIINMSAITSANGATQEWRFNRDGSWEPIEALFPERFDPRGREWFYRGYLRPGVSWTNPYEFREGGLGITAVKAIHSGTPGSWIGTMTADFRIDAITNRLRSISDQFAGSLLMIIHDKEDVFIAIDDDQGPVIDAVQAVMADQARLDGSGDFALSDAGNTTTFLYSAKPLDIIEGLTLDLIYFVPVGQSAFGTIQDSVIRTILVSALILIACLAAAYVVARSIAHPVEQLGEAVRHISLRRLHDFKPIKRHWLKEIDQTRVATNKMVAGLQKGEQVRSNFGRYIPEALVSALEQGSVELKLGGHEADVTAMFTDIEGFTRISEQYSSDELVTLLNRYFAEVLDVIERNNGMVVDFIGDGLFAIFGAPITHADHSDQGINCALQLIERTEAFEKQLEAENIHWGRTRIGLNSGTVIAGNVGGAGRQKYTALGDVVNTASRIEGLNKQVGTRMLAASTTLAGATLKQKWRSLGVYQFVGKAKPLEIFEAIAADTDPEQLKAFDESLLACRRNAPEAKNLVDAYTAKYGEDKALTLHLMQMELGQDCSVITLNKK